MERLTSSFWAAMAAGFIGAGALFAAGAAATSAALTPPPGRLRTQVFAMDLPPGWSCELDDGAFFCRKETPASAVAIIAQKYRNDQDNLDAYAAHVAEPTERNHAGESWRSTVLDVKRVRIGDHDWIDALHDGGEVRNWYTRYLATQTSHVGVLVTFSAAKSRFAEIERDFERARLSMVIHQRGELAPAQSRPVTAGASR